MESPKKEIKRDKNPKYVPKECLIHTSNTKPSESIIPFTLESWKVIVIFVFKFDAFV